jgi:hypothetical protein
MALAARQMDPATNLSITFDGEEDVLYVSLGAPVPSHVDEGEAGLLFRWANADNRPSGVTALDFRRNWLYQRAAFYSAVAEHLSLPAAAVERAVERAL